MVIVACSPIRVNTIYDDGFPFKDLDSFCWMNGCEFNIDGPSYLAGDTAVVRLFMNEIKTQLTGKGFVYDEETPDFVINLHVVAFEKEVAAHTPYHIYGQENDFSPFISEDTYQYLEGSLIVDIANYETSKIIWRSDVVGYTDFGTAFTDKTIKKVIKKAMAKFPPEP